MSKHIRIALLGSISLLLLTVSLRVSAQPGSMVSFQLFYDQLSPYGEWVHDPQHGYVWLPDAGPNFMPYGSNGYWVMTKYGNTWVSDYDWGWAPFHYGRWVHTDWYGWAWIPGYEWGPAWVSWRSGGGYYGWAPLGPGMGIGVSVNIRIPSHHWVFVPRQYITSHRIHRYYVPRRNYVNIYNRTTIINNTYVYNNRTYVSGPSRRDLERATRGQVRVMDIRDSSRPVRSSVDNRSVNLYRPTVDQNTRTQARPTRVTETGAVAARRSGTRTAAEANGTRTAVERSNSRAVTRGSARPQTRAATPARQPRTQATSSRSSSGRAVTSGNGRAETRAATPARQSRTQATSSRSSSGRAVTSGSRATQSRQAVSSRDNRTESRGSGTATRSTRNRGQ